MNLKKTSSAILQTSLKILVYIIVVVVFYLVCSNAFSFGEKVFTEEGMAKSGEGTNVQITIPQGASTLDIGDILSKNGLIDSSYAFALQAFLYEADIKPGKYELSTEYSPEEIIEALRITDKDTNEE
jgi:cell division protein YceG involved in septum cleavage